MLRSMKFFARFYEKAPWCCFYMLCIKTKTRNCAAIQIFKNIRKNKKIQRKVQNMP